MDLSKMTNAALVTYWEDGSRVIQEGRVLLVGDELARRLVENELAHTTRLHAAEADADEHAELLRDTEKALAAAKAEIAALKARAEAAEKVVADIDIALYPETDPYGEGDSFRADAMWDIHKIRQAARTPTPTPATGQEETR